jgi:maltose/maltodextrin transport system substrate-binding protein
MKRILSLIVALGLIMMLTLPLAAQRKKITVWCTDKEVAGLEPVKKSFKRSKKIDVEIEIQAEPRSKYISAARAGTAPDILVGAHDWVGELAKNGVIAEINLSNQDKAKYFPLSIQGYTYNNKLYGVPYDFEALVIFYNKKLINKVPGTWEDLKAAAQKMTDTKSGKYGFLYGINNDFHRNFPFFGSQGGYIFGYKDGKYDIMDVGLDNAGSIAAGKFIYSLVKDNVVPSSTNNGTVESSFLDGKVAMVMDGCWNYRSYINAIGLENLGVAKLPTLNGKKSVSFIGARGFMINNASKVLENAKDFVINFAGEKEGQIAMFKAGGRPPAHMSASDEIFKTDPNIKIMIDSANDGMLMPNVKAMAVVWNYAGGMIDKFNTGETTVENALKTAVNTIKDEIGKKQSRYE